MNILENRTHSFRFVSIRYHTQPRRTPIQLLSNHRPQYAIVQMYKPCIRVETIGACWNMHNFKHMNVAALTAIILLCLHEHFILTTSLMDGYGCRCQFFKKLNLIYDLFLSITHSHAHPQLLVFKTLSRYDSRRSAERERETRDQRLCTRDFKNRVSFDDCDVYTVHGVRLS